MQSSAVIENHAFARVHAVSDLLAFVVDDARKGFCSEVVLPQFSAVVVEADVDAKGGLEGRCPIDVCD